MESQVARVLHARVPPVRGACRCVGYEEVSGPRLPELRLSRSSLRRLSWRELLQQLCSLLAYLLTVTSNRGACLRTRALVLSLTWQKRYNDLGFYERVTGADLGMSIQLMHPPGEDCPLRSVYCVDDFTIIHTNGIHKRRVYFCKCAIGHKVPPPIQLMRRRFWPATCENPQTATTFEALDLFTRLTAQGRLNIYDFHQALQDATDGAMLRGIAVRRKLPRPWPTC